MADLISRLRAASAGHTATYGDAVPNLFADALAEIQHLRKLEDAARNVCTGFPNEGTAYWQSPPNTSLETLVKTRMNWTRAMVDAIRKEGDRP